MQNITTEIRFVLVLVQAGNNEMFISQIWLDDFSSESHAH